MDKAWLESFEPETMLFRVGRGGEMLWKLLAFKGGG